MLLTRRSLIHCVVLTVAFGALGVAVASVASVRAPQPSLRTNDPTAYSPLVNAAEYDSNISADQAVADSLAGLDAEVLPEFALAEPPMGSSASGGWIYATIAGHDASSEAIGIWQADLAQGAVAERLAHGVTNLANVVSGATLQYRDEKGNESAVVGGAGDVTAGQVFAGQTSGASDEALTSSVTSALNAYGLEPDLIRILHPLGPAVEVIATVPDVSALKQNYDAIFSALGGKPKSFEGVYLEIRLPGGRCVVHGSVAYRTGAGRLWVDPAFDAMVGATHGSPAIVAGSR